MSEGLYKLVDCQSFYSEDDVTVSLINLKDVTAGLEKSAADDRISRYVSDQLKPKPGKFYLHINAMGAGEYYGSNKNADYFPEAQLKQYHKTFEETGYVYRHHINKDPAKSMGRVIFAIYNERMHRVELIAELDMELAKDIYEKIQRGEFPQTSMACRTPWDICSICGNKAHSRAEYCTHILNEPNRLMANGKRVMALNLGPLRFFDISVVIKPADVTSSVLQKVASHVHTILSVDAAAAEGIGSDYWNTTNLEKEAHIKAANRIKIAAIEKMSDLIKRIDGGEVLDILPVEESVLARISEPGKESLDILSSVPLEESLNSLAELGIVPSISFLANLIARRVYGNEVSPALGEVAAEIITKIPAHLIPPDSASLLGNIVEKDANHFVLKALQEDRELTKQAQGRYYHGYIDLDQTYVPRYVRSNDVETNLREQALSEAGAIRRNALENAAFFSAILKLGGAALLGKFVISSLIDQKMEKVQKSRLKSEGVTKLAMIIERSVVREFKNGRQRNQ